MTARSARRESKAAPNDIVVRELRWSDYPSLREMYYLLYEEREAFPEVGITLFEARPTDDDEVAWFQGLYRRALSGESIVAVAERDGLIVGHCTVSSVGRTTSAENAHVGELGILVHRDHRASGVGRALLERTLSQCRRKFEIVRLTVFSVNARARRLYEEFGFAYVGTVPRAIRRGVRYFDEDLMYLELARKDANR
ncbi:MAG: GNAT family N-acetyltransferase [Thermoplasmata archaeon]